METSSHDAQRPVDGDQFSEVVTALRTDGYVILNNAFPLSELQTLFSDIKGTEDQHFQAAGIGRKLDHQLNPLVRQDQIHWLNTNHAPATPYLNWIEQLRQRLNRELFLGLFDYECHYARYPQGGFYKKHYDAFKGESIRRLSTILYLNPDWQANDGGELVLYAADDTTILETVSPTFGTMVIFLSEDFPHEVLAAGRSRYSLTGWFRVNSSNIST